MEAEMMTTPPRKPTCVEEADCAIHLLIAGEQMLSTGDVDQLHLEGQQQAYEALIRASKQLSELSATMEGAERRLMMARSNLRAEQAELVRTMMRETLALTELAAAEAELQVYEVREILYPSPS